ncbi:helix-turn-helix domain-containing protein [Pedobacter sp. ASV28]|uniref:helix-turn-helix domain-containing protein n=1 Tax=Pedobacter sp. ASV28 TaxID=2795123 RepID=UPI0018ED56B2|nr:AraC family transcriptional regulator [Pedobacter sp. ASV28]
MLSTPHDDGDLDLPEKKNENNIYIFFVIDNITILLSYWDKDKICKFANKSYRNWFGLGSPEEIDKLSLKKLIGSSNSAGISLINEVLKGATSTFKQNYLSPIGVMTPCLVTLKPHWLNNVVQGFTAQIVQINKNNYQDDNFKGWELLLDKDMVMEKVAEYIRQHIFRPFPGISELSSMHFVSSAKLKRDFKKWFATTPFAYYRHQQMQYADEQIQNHLSSKKELAGMLNFSNTSNFYKCYKDYKLNYKQ